MEIDENNRTASCRQALSTLQRRSQNVWDWALCVTMWITGVASISVIGNGAIRYPSSPEQEQLWLKQAMCAGLTAVIVCLGAVYVKLRQLVDTVQESQRQEVRLNLEASAFVPLA